MENKVSQRALLIAEEVANRTRCMHYRLVLNEERQPQLTGSKIGGVPYWPRGKKYPVDASGKKMLMLMQINCAEAGLQDPLPQHGMLQWFISLNPELMYGCRGNFDEKGEGFRIVWHEDIDVDAMPLRGIPTHNTVDDMLTPVKHEVAIDVVGEETAMGVTDGHFQDLFNDILKEITGVDHSDQQWYQYLDNTDALYFEQHMGMEAPRHQMLGYPVYTQGEARRDMESLDTLLFQLDSQFSTIDRKTLVMWGDMGSGFIFINRNDLESKSFDKAYYTWDCG